MIKGANTFDSIEEAREYILKRRKELQEVFDRVESHVRGGQK